MPTALVWTPEEDDQLQRLVDQHGSKKWSLIASKLRSKSSKQCRRRWKNYLSINAKNCSWSTEEDAQLLAAHAELGNRWTEISKIFGDRTDNAVKNRYHALARKHPSLSGAGGLKRARQPGTPSEGSLSLGGADDGAGRHHHARHGYGGVREAVVAGGGRGGGPVLPSPFEQMSAGAPGGAGGPGAPPPRHPHAPLAIRVSREMLSPWELQLAQQVNAMAAPVHIDVVSGPGYGGGAPAADTHHHGGGGGGGYQAAAPSSNGGGASSSDALVARASWRHLLEGLGLEASGPGAGGPGGEQAAVADLISWLSTSLPAPNLATPPPEREEDSATRPPLTRRASQEQRGGGGGGESLTEDHIGLLRRLVSRSVEARGGSLEISRLLSIDLEPSRKDTASGRGFSSPRSDPLLRTRASWRSRTGLSPEMSPGVSFDFPRLGSGHAGGLQRLHKHGGNYGGKTAGNDATGMHVNSTFSSAELQLLVDALLPRPSMAR